MSGVFPFNHPLPTAFYLVCMIAAWSLHFFLVGYVWLGSAWLALAPWWERRAASGADPSSGAAPGSSTQGADAVAGAWQAGPIAALARDWMPIALGVAVTAGVAPLLFIQVLYAHEFYTANLLLAHRFMALLPALIAAFYLFYVQKTRAFTRWPRLARGALALTAFACVLYVALSWSRNYCLLVHRDEWTAVYARGARPGHGAQLALRAAGWMALSVVNGAALLRAQVALTPDRALVESHRSWRWLHLLPALVLAGTALALVVLRDQRAWAALSTPAALAPWILAAASAAGALVSSLVGLAARQARKGPALAGLGFAAGLTVAASWLREVLRAAAVDLEPLYARHEQAATRGGLWIFILFAVVNAASILIAVRLARRGRWEEPNVS